MSFISKLFNQRDNGSNPQLVESVRAVLHADNPQTRQALCSVFQRSTLIVPTVRLRHGNEALPMMLKDPRDHLALPVFSSLDAFSHALREWSSRETHYNSI